MRRPLLAAALCLVAVASIRLETGMAERGRPGIASTKQLEKGGTFLFTGQVCQKEEQAIYLQSLSICHGNLEDGEESAAWIPLEEKLICETGQSSEFLLGSRVTIRGEWVPYSHATNPGEFDAAAYYRTLGIGGKLRDTVVLEVGGDYWRVRESLYRLRGFFKERLYQVFSQEEGAVMSALLLGDKGELDSELKGLYQRNGILHILSISSLHITIIGMGVYKLLRKSGIPIGPAAAAGSVILLLYGGMTGFGISACRAIGMYLIRMFGELVGRTYDMLTALGVLAAIMVSANPYYLQSGGFLLSFGSVMGIGVLYPVLQPNMAGFEGKVFGRLRRGLWGAVLASLSVTLATLPIQLFFYYEIPVYSVFLNLFIIPLMKPLMITGLLTLLPGLGFFGVAGRLILETYKALCVIFDGLPFHTWNPGCPAPWQIVLYYLLLFGVAVWANYEKQRRSRIKSVEKNFRQRVGAKLYMGVLAGAVLVFGIRPAGENSVTFLDVGQGDCILVRTASGENYLFDCGSSSRKNIGKYVLLPYLKYYGIQEIDAMFLSHPDGDHINGALELLEAGSENHILIRQVLLPEIEERAREEAFGELLHSVRAAGQAQGSPVRIGYLSAGAAWDLGSATFTCLHPGKGWSGTDTNAYSECFLVEFKGRRKGSVSDGKWTLVLTGDVEGAGEKALREELQALHINKVTVFKAAHHGSRNATSMELLEQLQPELTVISCGRDNRYGHPHEELIERLQKIDTHIMGTAKSGAVRVTFREGRLKVWAMMAGNGQAAMR